MHPFPGTEPKLTSVSSIPSQNLAQDSPTDGVAVAALTAPLVLPHVSPVRTLSGDVLRRLTAKRIFDLVGALVAVVAASPLLLSLALLVKISSKGPVIFWQRRLGQSGRPFRCFKFRTMTADAEAILGGMLATDSNLSREFQERAKLKDDPRLTRYGRLLRRSSLDELPQLFNVLMGDMSLVGPRPLVPAELVRYGEASHALLSVKPGITGLWQVSGRNNLSYPERIAADLSYIRSHTLLGDVRIILRTFVQIFRPGRNGAY
jgi:lipopolysaccharide/colanic/teichoic acid biosynthesis glycosyltransferase